MKKQKRKDKRSRQTLVVVCVLVIVVLLAIIAVLLLRGNGAESEETEEKRNVVVTQENVDEVTEQMASEAQEFVEPGYYTVNMDTDWHFSDGDAVSEDARVDNLAENTHDVYFDVFLLEDEETPIYQSPVIPRGAFLEHIALDTSLEAGTYDCVIVYHLVDENQKTVSTLRVSFQIIVES